MLLIIFELDQIWVVIWIEWLLLNRLIIDNLNNGKQTGRVKKFEQN